MPSTELRSDDEMLAVTKRRAEQLRAARNRRRALLVGLTVVILVVGSAVVVRARTDAPTVYATDDAGDPATETSALPAPPGWSPMAASPLSGRGGAVSAWTGREWLLWRGDGAFSDACASIDGTLRCGEQAPADGAAYDPGADSWRMLPPAPLAEDQGDQLTYGGVWTGSELVVWGGPDGSGAAYDPVTDAWRPIAAAPISPRRNFSMVWTGTEAIVVGGLAPGFTPNDLGELGDGAAFDPATDQWRTIAEPGSAGIHGAGVWCNGSLVLLDDLTDDDQTGATAIRYEAASDRWSALAASPVEYVSGATCAGGSVVAVGSAANHVGSAAAALDPVTGAWTTLAAPPVVDPVEPAVVWTGSQVVVLGSALGSDPADPVAVVALDPIAGAWSPMPDPGLSARGAAAAVWADGDLLVWGGAHSGGFTSEPVADGARYHPGSGSFPEPTTLDGAAGSMPPPDPDPGAVPSDPESGAVAVWDVDPAAPPTSDASTVTVLVTRLGCSGGVTGKVLRPGLAMTEAEIILRFTVEPLDPEQTYACPGNDAVPYVVELGEPIGARTLVDGTCSFPGEGTSTTYCSDSAGVRWRSDGEGIRRGNFSVTGQMVSVGGPAGAGPDPAPGDVRVLDIHGLTLATAATNEDGTFQLLLPNGTYRVVGRSDRYQSGQVDCVAEDDVVVRDRWVGGVTVACQRR